MARNAALLVSTVAVAVALLALLGSENAEAGATYVVGDNEGWHMNMKGWTNGKVFRAGDILKFNYDGRVHNVVKVNERDYEKCKSPKNAKVLNSGKDEIELSTGNNFFICNLPGHCHAGMKIHITALPNP